jgi:hypothetical protein
MEISLIFPFLDPEHFFLQLISIFPIILYNLLIYMTIWRYKEDLKLSRLLLISSLIALGVALATFFLPGISASHVSEEEVLILNLYSILIPILTLIPMQFFPALSLLIFGYFNIRQYKYYLLLAGTFLFAYYVFSFINFAFTILLSPSEYLENIILYTFLSYVFLVMILTAYAFLIVHGVLNKQPFFRSTGIVLVSTVVFLFFFSSFFYNLIFGFFRGI